MISYVIGSELFNWLSFTSLFPYGCDMRASVEDHPHHFTIGFVISVSSLFSFIIYYLSNAWRPLLLLPAFCFLHFSWDSFCCHTTWSPSDLSCFVFSAAIPIGVFPDRVTEVSPFMASVDRQNDFVRRRYRPYVNKLAAVQMKTGKWI